MDDPTLTEAIDPLEAEDIQMGLLFDIREKWRQKNEERDTEFNGRRLKMVDAHLNNASQALSSLDDLNTILTDAAVAKAGTNEEQAEKARKKGFERSKKLQLGMAIIQGIQGTMAAFTAGSSMGPAGVVMGPLMASMAAIGAGVNIAKIKASKYGSSTTGGLTPPPPPRVPNVTPPNFNIIGNSTENQLAPSLGGQEQPVIKTYVVSEDVTSAQSLDRNKVETATL